MKGPEQQIKKLPDVAALGIDTGSIIKDASRATAAYNNSFLRFGPHVASKVNYIIGNQYGIPIESPETPMDPTVPDAVPSGYRSMLVAMPLPQEHTLVLLPKPTEGGGDFDYLVLKGSPAIFELADEPLCLTDWEHDPEASPRDAFLENLGIFHVDQETMYEPTESERDVLFLQARGTAIRMRLAQAPFEGGGVVYDLMNREAS